MFIQTIQGRCNRRDELRDLIESWPEELGPGATGWLGGTYGFADDNLFVGVVRFESREAAMANSARPEQDAWAKKLMALMEGPLEFHDSDDVTLMMDGGSDDAGFVQVIRSKIDEPERLKALMTDTEVLHEVRPDIIGATLALEEDGTFTETIAFTSEAAAREAERRAYPETPEEVRKTLEMVMKDATFYDLHEPWFASR